MLDRSSAITFYRNRTTRIGRLPLGQWELILQESTPCKSLLFCYFQKHIWWLLLLVHGNGGSPSPKGRTRTARGGEAVPKKRAEGDGDPTDPTICGSNSLSSSHNF